MKLLLYLFVIAGTAFFSSILSISQAHAEPCRGSEHFETIRVFSEGLPVFGAIVTFYTNSEHTRIADNLLLAPPEDAVVTTGAGGEALLALTAGTYEAHVVAEGYESYTASVIMPSEGVCGDTVLHITPRQTSLFDATKTTIHVDRLMIPADGTSTSTVTIRVMNRYGSVVPFVPVSLQTSLAGMRMTPQATSTNGAGEIQFSLTGIVPGAAIVSPFIQNTLVQPFILTLVSPLVSNVTTVSTTLSALSTVPISSNLSEIRTSDSLARSDGSSFVTISILVRDERGIALPSRSVTLRSSAPLISIEPDYAFTNANGYALFTLRASSTVSGSLTAVAEGIPLNQHPEISFIPNASEHISVGARIKLPDDHQVATQADSTIYYIGSDGRRHPFLNENIYLNWYPDFRGILTVSAQELAKIELGLPVSYRPGSRLVKFISDPKVYAISKPGNSSQSTS
jgi:hypothetical protein